MCIRECGLTDTYNLFHDPSDKSPDVEQLRNLQVELDQQATVAYGWTDIDLRHDFCETKQGIRYTLVERLRRVVLDRLLELNYQRHAEEVAAGLHTKNKLVSSSTKFKSAEKIRQHAAQDTLFIPEDIE